MEEIARHTAAGKRVMIYFADLPARPSGIDPVQLRALADFKEEWSAKACLTFASTSEELEQRLYADLEVLMNEPEFSEPGQGRPPVGTHEDVHTRVGVEDEGPGKAVAPEEASRAPQSSHLSAEAIE